MSASRRGAIIGFGNVAVNGHVPGWRSRSDFSIVAVADPDQQRRELAAKLLPGVRTYRDHEELFRNEQLDFIDIAAPPAWHLPAIEAAAAAGAHVLCEKPLTTSLPELERIQTVVQEAAIVLHTVHNWKYSEAFRTLQRMMQGDALGPLRSVTFNTVRNGCAAATGENWRMNPNVAGGGILVDHGWHAFYLLLALADERPLRINAQLERRRYADALVEDTAHCVVDFPTLTGDIRLTWAAEERHTRWSVQGRDGELVIDDDRVLFRGRRGPQEQRLSSALSASSHHPDWFGGVIDEFRAALQAPSEPHANQNEAALCVQLLHQAYASNRQQQPMEIPPLV